MDDLFPEGPHIFYKPKNALSFSKIILSGVGKPENDVFSRKFSEMLRKHKFIKFYISAESETPKEKISDEFQSDNLQKYQQSLNMLLIKLGRDSKALEVL